MKYPDDFINKIIQGDCLDVMKDIPDKSIDMILCDLPYGTTACKWDTIIPFEPLWEQYKRIIKNNGAIVLTASQPFTSALVMSNIKMFKYEWIWDKKTTTNAFTAHKMPMKAHENICVFGNKINYYPQKESWSSEQIKRMRYKTVVIEHSKYESNKNSRMIIQGRDMKVASGRFPQSVIRINGIAKMSKIEEIVHPTQKPVALFEYLIKTYTNEKDLVLDNCAGSGTTGVACQNLSRNFILIEKEKKYCEIARQRLRQEVLNF